MRTGCVGDAVRSARRPTAPTSPRSHELLSIFDKSASQPLCQFVQYERLNTQDEVPAGFSEEPGEPTAEAWTFGAAFYPDPQIVIKADYQRRLRRRTAPRRIAFALSIGLPVLRSRLATARSPRACLVLAGARGAARAWSS